MIVMIQVLLEKKYAYVVEGNVFLILKNTKEYGHLSNRTLDEMISGSRIEVSKSKKSYCLLFGNHLQRNTWVGESLGNRRWLAY